jgi:DNA topoisomerase-1
LRTVIIKANYGRFGPYIQYGKKYVSLKEITPEEVTLNEALTLIKAKEKFDAERIIKTFDDSEIQVLNGRFAVISFVHLVCRFFIALSIF